MSSPETARLTGKMLIPPFLRRRIKAVVAPTPEWAKFGQTSYAQEGEDLLLHKIFHSQKSGFYVDVGAHHPWRYSNTFLFYQMGWRGVNIDPRPGTKKLFDRHRPRDINIEMAISDYDTEYDYYEYNAPELNGFSPNAPAMHRHPERFKVVTSHKVRAKPLSHILRACVDADQAIDFLSVDVEGHDLQVLRSNDWARFRPSVVVAECRDLDLESISADPVVAFLHDAGYRLIARLHNSCFFSN